MNMAKRTFTILILIVILLSTLLIIKANSEDKPSLQEYNQKKPALMNEMINPGLKQFKETVQRQGETFPDLFFLHAFTEEKKLALTFDDGPDAKYTPQILDILKNYKVKATFFVTGENTEKYPEIVLRMVDEGHIVGGHSYNHPDLRKIQTEDSYSSQIEKTSMIINKTLGYKPDFFRPPYGAVTDEQIILYGEKGLKVVNWSVDSFDWDKKQNSPEQLEKIVNKYIHPGAIVLMHSAGGNRSNTVKALPEIIKSLHKQGYIFETIPDLLEFE